MENNREQSTYNIIMKTISRIIAAVSLIAIAASCGQSTKKAEADAAAEKARADSLAAVAAAKKQKDVNEKLAALPEEPVFDIQTNMGTIRIKLYSKTPKHRENFARLAFSGFYDGILFHRVIDGFMVQAGDPYTKNLENKPKFGTGGPGYTLPAEFVPEYTHKKGALAAARKGDAANPLKESSGSQFYIVQNESACAPLNGDYTVFGETIDGIKVVDKIAAVARDGRDCPVEPVKIISVKLVEE